MKPHYYTYNHTQGYEAWTKHESLANAITTAQKESAKRPDRQIEILKCVAITKASEPTTEWTCDNDNAKTVIDDIKQKSPVADTFKLGDRVQVANRGSMHGFVGTVSYIWKDSAAVNVTLDLDGRALAFFNDELERVNSKFALGQKVWILANELKGQIGTVKRVLHGATYAFDVDVAGRTLAFCEDELSPVEPTP